MLIALSCLLDHLLLYIRFMLPASVYLYALGFNNKNGVQLSFVLEPAKIRDILW